MCDTCGCNITPGNAHLVEGKGKLARTGDGKAAVEVLQGLLHENDHQALHNREHFDRHGTLAVNLMSSPGSGKTTLLEQTIERLAGRLGIAVIEGDLETENDARRIRRKGVPAVQISTGSACHLDAHMVHDGLHQLDLDGIDILFVENVGNLVCPASFDLGHHRNVTLLSVTEGDDKPAKYPVMFRGTDLMLISKADLLPVLEDFDPGSAEQHFRHLANTAPVYALSAKTGAGLDEWIAWLEAELAAHRARIGEGGSTRPRVQGEGAALHAAELRAKQGHHHGHDHDHDHEHGHHHAQRPASAG
jgi:hydrogenase nickel incorporation protein HypB